MIRKKFKLTNLVRYFVVQAVTLEVILFLWIYFNSLNWILSSLVSLLIFLWLLVTISNISNALKQLEAAEDYYFDSGSE